MRLSMRKIFCNLMVRSFAAGEASNHVQGERPCCSAPFEASLRDAPQGEVEGSRAVAQNRYEEAVGLVAGRRQLQAEIRHYGTFRCRRADRRLPLLAIGNG